MKEHVDRYVDALLRKRRPKPFAPTQDEIEMLAVAIDLAAGAPGGAQPRPGFVEQLGERLKQQEQAEQDAATRPAWRTPARRRFLAAGALTVSGAAVGVAGAQLFALGTEAAVPAAEPTAPSELTPVHGSWQAVADSASVPEGSVLSFDLGAITGFVRRMSGRVQAVSGICTHQGCRLELTAGRNKLACPCHGATFTLAGANLTHPRITDHALPALPRLPVREQDGRIEVYGPAPQSAADPGPDQTTDPSTRDGTPQA